MFKRRTPPEKIVAMASILLLGGALPLSAALIAQFGFQLPPCHFCLLQRYPYLLVMLCGALLLVLPRMGLRWRAAVALGIYGLLATAALGLIHTGIENGTLHYTGGCVAQTVAGQSLEALRAQIAGAPIVACDNPMVQFAGLTMATWNSLWAGFVILLIALQYRFERRVHGQ